MENVIKPRIILVAVMFVPLMAIGHHSQAQSAKSSTVQSYITEAKSELTKAISDNNLSDSQRIKMVERSAKTLKEYGQPPAMPGGDLPFKTQSEARYRIAQAQLIYINDMKMLFSNKEMSQQLRLITDIQIDVVSEQIKLFFPGEDKFEFSKDLVGTVFSWNIKDGFNGGKRGDAQELAQKFKNLVNTREFVKYLNRLYDLQYNLLIQRYDELKHANSLQAQLKLTYQNAANSSFVFKEFQNSTNTSQITIPNSTGNISSGSFRASLPGGWKIEQSSQGQFSASAKREVTAKSNNCVSANLSARVTATLTSNISANNTSAIDKSLRAWMSESGLYPKEAGIENISIAGFSGRLLTSTMQYNNGYGSPVSGYKAGMAHISGYAILKEVSGSRAIKVSYSSVAGSCWDNKSSDKSIAAAQSGKSEAMELIRRLSVSGGGTSNTINKPTNTSSANITIPNKTSIYVSPKSYTGGTLRDQMVGELMKVPSPKGTSYWQQREAAIKKKPIIRQPQTNTQPQNSNPSISVNPIAVSNLIGDWDVITNGYSGKMEIRLNGTTLVGRIYFDVYRKWEPLDNLNYNPNTRKFTFTRPNAKQQYEAIFNGTTLTGSFDRIYKWTGKKTTRSYR